MKDSLVFAAFVGCVLGLLIGMAFAYRVETNKWRCWAVKNNYAHYSPDTGEFVLEPNTQE